MFDGINAPGLGKFTINIFQRALKQTLNPSVNDQFDPEIYGDQVVWHEFNGTDWDIYQYDPSTGTGFWHKNYFLGALSAMDQINSNILGHWVAYETYTTKTVTLGSTTQTAEATYTSIFFQNYITGDSTDLVTSDEYDSFFPGTTLTAKLPISETTPSVYGSAVVFTHFKNVTEVASDQKAQIEFALNLGTNLYYRAYIDTSSEKEFYPSIYNKYVVWEDRREEWPRGKFPCRICLAEINYYPLTLVRTPDELIKTDLNWSQERPKIWGNWVVWEERGILFYTQIDHHEFWPTVRYKSGTSMAAPYVAGQAALILTRYPTMTYPEVENLIEQTADTTKDMTFERFGFGRINLFRSLSETATYIGVNEPNDILSQATSITAPSASTTQVTNNVYICPNSDTDYFSFTATPSGSMTAILENIPSGCNYDLHFYVNPSTGFWTQINASSTKLASTTETIGPYQLESGNKYVFEVRGVGGYSTTQPATLKISFDPLGAAPAPPSPPTTPTLPGALPSVPTIQAEVNRILGTDRYQTAVEISKKGWSSASTVIIATGENFPDALTIASYAANKGIPIFLTQQLVLPEVTLSTLNSLGIDKTIVVGGSGVVSDSLLSSLPNPTRTWGYNRYETAKEVAIYAIKDNFSWSTILIAKGTDFSDALAGSPYGAKIKSPMLLVHPTDLSNSLATKAALTQNKSQITELYLLGGTGAISDEVKTQLENALK